MDTLAQSKHSSATTLEIITLNCWALKFISVHTDARIAHIARVLEQSTSDIICLQEIWQERHWLQIKSQLSKSHPHAKYYYSGMMGSGLAILSRYPIRQTEMRPYTLNGRPQAFFRGDWFVGKGVASAIIELPGGQLSQIFNTHMHAPYNERIDTYLCHRTAQGWDLRKMLKASTEAGYITFATGDFNSIPGSLVHRFITAYLSDSFVTLNPGLPLLPDFEPDLSAAELVSRYGVTCDVAPLNTWRSLQAPDMPPKRLDYVFHDHHAIPAEVQVIFTDVVQPQGCSASDHFGLRCVYTIQSQIQPMGPGSVELRPLHLQDFDEMLQNLDWYTKRQLSGNFMRNSHFWLSIVFVIYLVSLVMNCSSPILRAVLAALLVFISVTGFLDGLIGFVFGRWEMRNLMEFGDEVQRARLIHKEKIQSNQTAR